MNDLIGLALPPVIDLINHKVSNSAVKVLLSLVISLIVGALLNLDKLNVKDAGDVLQAGLVVFGSAQVTYQLYWKKSLDRQQMVSKLQGKSL
jgi:hypothetical protein